MNFKQNETVIKFCLRNQHEPVKITVTANFTLVKTLLDLRTFFGWTNFFS